MNVTNRSNLAGRRQVSAVGEDKPVWPASVLVSELLSTHSPGDLKANYRQAEACLPGNHACEISKPVIYRPPPGQRCVVIGLERKRSDPGIPSAKRFERDTQIEPVITAVLPHRDNSADHPLPGRQLNLAAQLARRKVSDPPACRPGVIWLPPDMPRPGETCGLSEHSNRRLKPGIVALAKLHRQLVISARPRIMIAKQRRQFTGHAQHHAFSPTTR
jgi:hypothetical protein